MLFVLGEAMESVDQTTVLYQSCDSGQSWSLAGHLLTKEGRGTFSDSAKVTLLADGQVAALGYRFDRRNPQLPIGNPQSGGVLDDQVFFCLSQDGGRTFGDPAVLATSFSGPVEASAPLTVLSSGAWATPIANFSDWSGNVREGLHGRLLRSDDRGASWQDSVLTMRFPGGHTAVWEQRLCEYLPGRLAVVAWVEDLQSGQPRNNHIALSADAGRSFAPPQDMGIRGQAAGLAVLGGGLMLSLHTLRKQTDSPGILAVVADAAGQRWRSISQSMIWHAQPAVPNTATHAVFSTVRFGQPSALALDPEHWLVVFWCEENGEATIRWIRLSVRVLW